MESTGVSFSVPPTKLSSWSPEIISLNNWSNGIIDMRCNYSTLCTYILRCNQINAAKLDGRHANGVPQSSPYPMYSSLGDEGPAWVKHGAIGGERERGATTVLL